jgi:hypothetical protein
MKSHIVKAMVKEIDDEIERLRRAKDAILQVAKLNGARALVRHVSKRKKKAVKHWSQTPEARKQASARMKKKWKQIKREGKDKLG